MSAKANKFWDGQSWKTFEFAKMLEEAERFEDMVKVVKAATEKDDNEVLCSENRNLLSIAYKNVVGQRRTAYRTFKSKLDEKEKSFPKECIESHLAVVVGELKEYCDEIIALIDKVIIPKVDAEKDSKDENKVFFFKMKGDYYRYMSEIEQDKSEISDKANEAYKEAKDASTNLPATHPIKLGLILNYSVFMYEIQNDSAKACKMAKDAFDNAIAELDQLEETDYKDSTLIMQLLRDNLTLWTSEAEGEEEDENKDDS